jgi:N-methylhydantoinase B
MSATAARVDPITLMVFGNALTGIAREMGVVLVQSAYSSNIKERADCSTALFDSTGRCLAQAAHIPVHLGALPDAVRAVIACEPEPGDAFILNDPFRGGSHLPDVTLVSACSVSGRVAAYAVSRAHYAEIGGKVPGSMPSDSREIYEEGLVIPPIRLVAGGEVRQDLFDLICANVRTPDLCAGDLRAQLAAATVGQRRISEIYATHGDGAVVHLSDALLDYTERLVRAFLQELPDGTYTSETEVEGDGVTNDDLPIRVAVTIDGDRISFDFHGTSRAAAGNVNCPVAVTRAACLFALRALLPAHVPTNAGVDACIEVDVEPGSLVSAARPSAVIAGNVETSQRIADCLFDALAQATDVQAQGQGTMNNLVIGGDAWSYYETLGGGQGASSSGDGDSGVHVGMSNTLNTPIEALESEFPLRVERYELRYGSGGGGLHRGGDGLERTLRVLAPATLSILSDRRRHAPAGRRGGLPGLPGQNFLNGEALPSKATRLLAANDVVMIRTPGGGGWGEIAAPQGDSAK